MCVSMIGTTQRRGGLKQTVCAFGAENFQKFQCGFALNSLPTSIQTDTDMEMRISNIPQRFNENEEHH